MYEYKSVNKYLSKNKSKSKKRFSSLLYSIFIKLLICVLIVVSVLIVIKIDKKSSGKISSFLYDNNISFARINKWYNEHFGDILPFSSSVHDNVSAVFSESLEYSDASIYKDGVSLSVAKSYLVPVLNDGIVVFSGEKDGYGKVVIVQQSDGVDVWYGNIENLNVKLYDYVSKGEFLGEVHSNLYLVFQKDGKFLDYKEFIS